MKPWEWNSMGALGNPAGVRQFDKRAGCQQQVSCEAATAYGKDLHELVGVLETVDADLRAGLGRRARPDRPHESVRQSPSPRIQLPCRHGHQRSRSISRDRALGQLRLGGHRLLELQAARAGAAGTNPGRSFCQPGNERWASLGAYQLALLFCAPCHARERSCSASTGFGVQAMPTSNAFRPGAHFRPGYTTTTPGTIGSMSSTSGQWRRRGCWRPTAWGF